MPNQNTKCKSKINSKTKEKVEDKTKKSEVCNV